MYSFYRKNIEKAQTISLLFRKKRKYFHSYDNGKECAYGKDIEDMYLYIITAGFQKWEPAVLLFTLRLLSYEEKIWVTSCSSSYPLAIL